MADNNGRGQASTRSRWHRLGCWIWLRIIVLVIVLSTLVAYSVEVFRCSSFEPTGDALYDRYAKAVISRQRWVLFHGGKHHPTYLPDSLLAQWESDFGSDPRYWQLRYFCARYKGGFGSKLYLSPAPGESLFFGWLRRWDSDSIEIEDNAWKHLQAGVDSGVADWMTLEILGHETKHLRKKAQSNEVDELDNLGLAETARRQLWVETSKKHEQAELDRLNAMIEADTSQAWPYYWRAQYWFYYGESELALADLKAGNFAPNNEISKLFPARYLLERMEHGDHLGNEILAGAIFEEDSSHGLRNWIQWKDVLKETVGMVAMGGNVEILQEMHLFSCRLGMGDNNDGWEPVVAAVLESLQAEVLLVEYGEDLTYQQRRAVMKMYKWAQAVQHYEKSRLAEMRPHLIDYPRLLLLEMPTNSTSSRMVYATVDSPNGKNFGRGGFWQNINPRHYYNRALWVQRQQQSGVIAVRETFEQLEYLDLTTLEWPDEWGNPY